MCKWKERVSLFALTTLDVYFLGYHRTKIAVWDCMLIRNYSLRPTCPCLLKVSKDKSELCDCMNRVAHIWNLTVLPCGFSVVTQVLPI